MAMREARICTQTILCSPTLSIRSCTNAMEASQPRGQVLGNWIVKHIEVLGGWHAQKVQVYDCSRTHSACIFVIYLWSM